MCILAPKGKSEYINMDKVEDASRLEEIGTLFSPSAPVANSISMKLPAFWPDAAEVWYTQADAQFLIQSVIVSRPSSTTQ